MFQFHTVTEDERARMASRSAIIPQSDARAYGMVTARTVNGGRKQPRTTSAEHTSDCVVIRPNGDRFTIKRRSNGRNHKVDMNALVDAQNARDRRHSVNASSLAPIGDSNH